MKNCLKQFRTDTIEVIEIGNMFQLVGILRYEVNGMYDLKKLEKRFHEFINVDKYYDKDEIRITEDLLKQEEALYIPFGEMRYFLVIEDERPVLYVHAFSRMDLDSICFVDEDGYTCHDVYMGENEEIRERYSRNRRGVRRYDRLKGLPKMDE